MPPGAPAGAVDRYGLRALVRQAAGRLAAAGVTSPQVDARILAEHLLGRALRLGIDRPQVKLVQVEVARQIGKGALGRDQPAPLVRQGAGAVAMLIGPNAPLVMERTSLLLTQPCTERT